MASGEFGWHKENAGDDTHDVAQKKPNSWGLYDMHGNVFEWCQDWFSFGSYTADHAVDPEGPPRHDDGVAGAGHCRVERGGSWWHESTKWRSAGRSGEPEDDHRDDKGLRVVLVPEWTE